MDHRRTVALTLAAAMCAASGCGGSSTSKPPTQVQTPTSTPTTQVVSSTSKPLTRAALIAKADLICKRVNAKRSSVTISSQAEYGSFMSELAAYEKAALAEFGKLAPPASLAGDWQTMVAQARAVADHTTEIAADVAAGNMEAEHSVVLSAEKVEAQLLALAKRDGFRDCSKNR